VILSCASLPLQSFSSRTRPPHSWRQATFRGVSCPFATTACGVNCMKARLRLLACRGHPRPAQFRPRRFSRPRRLAPPHTLRVCFTPQPRTGFRPSGSSPHSLPCELVARRCPHVVHVHPLPLGLFIGARDVRPPTGSCSVRESVADRRGLAHVLPATLLDFSFFGFFFARRGNAFTSPPSTAFHGPRRITDSQPGVLLRPRLPRPRFLASPF